MESKARLGHIDAITRERMLLCLNRCPPPYLSPTAQAPKALKREQEEKRTNTSDQFSQRNLYNFQGFFPPPPPPPPPLQSRLSKESDERQHDASIAESSNAVGRQQTSSSIRGSDASSSAQTGPVTSDLSRGSILIRKK
ncbi:hypothetical protein COOONC_24266 [Cooperia oncophora]